MTLPLPTMALLPFFHTIMKETTSYAYCTSPKIVIHPENGATKVDYQDAEEEISQQIITILLVYIYGSEIGQDWLCLGCKNLQFHERNKIIHSCLYIFFLFVKLENKNSLKEIIFFCDFIVWWLRQSLWEFWSKWKLSTVAGFH